MALITGSTDFARARRRRPRHRGGVRGHGRQEARCSPSSTGWPSRARCSPPTPPLSTSTRSPRVTVAAAGRARACISSSPANVMRLLEIVRGAKTAPDALATALAARPGKIGKVPVVVGVCHGFVGNRMLRARSRRGRAAAARRRAAAGGRRGADRVRLADGAVRDGRPRRPRRRLAHPQGARRARR